jgi:1-acyl-sn-glycerol-3-phosphate acyltransferase
MNHTFLILGVGLLYLFVALRLALFFLPAADNKLFRGVASLTGRVEWCLRPWRNWLAFLFFFEAAGWLAYKGLFTCASAAAGFILLSVFSEVRFRYHLRRMAEFARAGPFIDPRLFFKYYYAGFGIVPVKLPCGRPIYACPPPAGGNVSPIDRAAAKRILPVFAGLFNTISLARMITAAYKWKGPKYSRDVADAIRPIWCGRAVQLAGMSVNSARPEKLSRLGGKFIFAFTHKSWFDFAVGPLAVARLHPMDRPAFRLRFLAAREHFLDNPLLYFIMGRALQVMGTIFVDRRGRKKASKNASLEAAERLAGQDIDIVIFPQGTRARANTSPDGKRLDAGYYTAGTKERLLKTGGHLKKGTAHIALDAAIALKDIEQSVVHIIPVGLIGTAIAAPRKKFWVQTGVDVQVKFGEPITVRGRDVTSIEPGTEAYDDMARDIHERLDNALKELLQTHAMLEQRFFKDIRGLVTPSEYEHTSVAMKAWRGKDYLIYAILDCIYAANPVNWPALVRELCHLLISDAPRASFTHFQGRVADMIS